MSEKLKKGNYKLDESLEKLFSTIDSVKGKKLFTDINNAGVDFKEKMYCLSTFETLPWFESYEK